MENDMEKFILEGLKNLSEGERRAVLARQEEERANRPAREISELTNAEVAARDDFKIFCEQRKTEPTTAQVRKHRGEFMQWLNENKKTPILDGRS